MTAPDAAELTYDDLVKRLGHTVDYWRRQAAAKKIPHRRFGRVVRFTEADYEAILAAAKVDAFDPLRSVTTRSRRK